MNTSTETRADAIPVSTWEDNDATWLSVRSGGIGASDVASILGYNRYTTPWKVWAEKTGQAVDEREMSAAAQLGIDLEPWLLGQAEKMLGEPVRKTAARSYAHPDYRHHLASPDGYVAGFEYGVELKTAGLFGFGTPEGWTEDSVPLGYEFQVRWQMHVMNWDRVYIIALVAGLGMVAYQIDRDPDLEKAMVTQVEDWWDRYVTAYVEPPLGRGDNDTLGDLYPEATNEAIDLTGTDALTLAAEYRRHAEAEKAAKEAKEATAAELKALLGENQKGLVEGRPLVTWANRLGSIDYKKALTKICEAHEITVPEDEIEKFRRNPTRTFAVKEIR